MANTLAIMHYKPHCFEYPTAFLFASRPNHKAFECCLRSPGNTNNGLLSTHELKWMPSAQGFCWKFKHEGQASKGVKAVHGGGNGGTGGAGGGGGPDGEGDGLSDDDDQRTHSFLSWYLMLLEKSPVTTKAVTSALLTFFGDLFCQLVIEKSSKVDMKRIFMFTLLGLILVGPTLHFWYLSLSKLISGSGASRAGMRLFLDQFLFSPLFIGVFFCSLLTLEGRPSEILPKLSQDWPASVVANWKLWIPFQFLNFLVVPQQLQVLAANLIALAWNVYLSFASHRTVAPTKSSDS
eukprot:Gb_27364 [translate_table: standard]